MGICHDIAVPSWQSIRSHVSSAVGDMTVTHLISTIFVFSKAKENASFHADNSSTESLWR